MTDLLLVGVAGVLWALAIVGGLAVVVRHVRWRVVARRDRGRQWRAAMAALGRAVRS